MSKQPAPENPKPEATVTAVVDEAVDSKSDLDASRNGGIHFVSTISKDEPVVTRRELWSYYSKCQVESQKDLI